MLPRLRRDLTDTPSGPYFTKNGAFPEIPILKHHRGTHFKIRQYRITGMGMYNGHGAQVGMAGKGKVHFF